MSYKTRETGVIRKKVRAGKMIKIFQKVGNYEGWVYDQNLPKGWKL